MIKPGRILLLIFILIFSGLYLSCERIDPVENEGDGNEFQTMEEEDVIFLNPDIFSFIGVVEGKYIFEGSGSQGAPSVGKIVYYYDEDNCISGKVEEMQVENNVLSLRLSSVPVNDFFIYLALKFNLEEHGINYFNVHPDAIQDGDTVLFDNIDFLWENGDNNSGLLNIDSLKWFNILEGSQQYYTSPVWNEGKATRKIGIEYNQRTNISASLKMTSKGQIDVADSILLREGITGPVYAGHMPVYLILREYLIVKIAASDDNIFSFEYTSEGNPRFNASYLGGEGWKLDNSAEWNEKSAENFNWEPVASFNAVLTFRTAITPVFCGQEGPSVSTESILNLNANIDWPQWNYYFANKSGAGLTSANTQFYGLPDAYLSSAMVEDIFLTDGGQLENTAPVPRFTVDPTSGFTDTNFAFDASSSFDKEDEPGELQVRWDFNGDEVWDTNYSITKQAFNIFSSPGNYTVVLEVLDTRGLTARLAKNVFVQAVSSAPTAYFTVSPESGRTTDLFTFDASGCWDAEDDVSLLKVRWDFDGNDVWDTQFSTIKAAVHFFRTPGTYVTKLEVKDTQGLTGSTSRIIEVEEANVKPEAFFTVTPQEGTINTNFLFDASGSSDQEDDISLLRVRWDFENDGLWDTEYRTIKTVNHIYPTASTYTAIVEVIDTDEFSNTFSRTILVKNPNTPPRADFTISPATGDTSTLFTFDARISTDLEDTLEQLQFRWDWDNNDVWDTEFEFNAIEQRTFSEVGTFIIRLQVRDSGGLTHTKARLVIVE